MTMAGNDNQDNNNNREMMRMRVAKTAMAQWAKIGSNRTETAGDNKK
jgi:hypothetical protein